MKSEVTYKRFYIWEFPVRVFHWVNFITVVGLVITGFLIANPPAILSELEASQQFWFGYIRMIHFILGYVLFWNLVFRIYWGFVGNEYVRWKNINPLKKEKRRELMQILKVDIFLAKADEIPSVGHNPLAVISYGLFIVILILQMATGFAYYAQMSSALLPKFFVWIKFFFGNDYNLKFTHHLLTWFFIIFAMIHIYIASYHDYVEGRGIISSMISGWKFIQKKKEN